MNTLLELRKRIPKVNCISNCSKCCGPVPMSHEEYQRIKILNIRPQRERCFSFTCMWLKDEKCTVYEERPLMCRAFGTTDVETHHLNCPHGAKCETPLSNSEIINLVDDYLNYMDYQGGTHRHTT